MGLAEKRAAKAFQDVQFPALRQQIDQAAGYAVPVEVNWEELSAPDYAELYDTAWTKIYFLPLIEALKEITVDDLGKQALQAAVKNISIRNQRGNSSAEKIVRLEQGVLIVDHEPVSNIDDTAERTAWIRKTLEGLL